MEERDFFLEKDETKPAFLNCPFCHHKDNYEIRWRRRTKKISIPSNATEEDHMRFAKSKSYLVRVDDLVACKNPRCRRRFEITTLQTVVFV